MRTQCLCAAPAATRVRRSVKELDNAITGKAVDALLNGELGVLIDPDEVGDIATALSAMLTRQHPLAILQAPDRLRARVIEAYGYRRFVERVAEQLHQLGIQTG